MAARQQWMSDLSPKRRLTVRLLRAGLVTPSEAADALGISRQRVYNWSRTIDHQRARKRRLRLMYKILINTPWALASHSRDIPGYQDLSPAEMADGTS